jgi:hypothetical protein
MAGIVMTASPTQLTPLMRILSNFRSGMVGYFTSEGWADALKKVLQSALLCCMY